MNRTKILVGVLILLVGVAVVVWMTSSGTEVDATFSEAKQTYLCPSCGGTFEVTGAESEEMLKSSGGIVCTLCGKKIDDYLAAKSPTGGTLGPSGENGDEDEVDEDAPPTPSGGMRKRDN